MLTIYFITGNVSKYKEAKEILPNLEQLTIDLPEIQETNPEKIIKSKLTEGLKYQKSPVIVEDMSLSLACLNGLPGPLIKWFIKSIGINGIYRMAEQHGNFNASATAYIGYAKNETDIKYFSATIEGTIVEPRGKEGFGFDPIFKPHNSYKTYAQMTFLEKNKISIRKKALEKLKEFLEN